MSSIDSHQKLETQEHSKAQKEPAKFIDDEEISENNNLLETAESFEKLRKVLYMGFSFFLLFTAFMSACSLIPEIYSQLGFSYLGNLASLILYLFFFGGSFVVPGLIKDWSYKIGVFIGSLGYFFTLIAGAITTSCGNDDNPFWCSNSCIFIVNLICAAINGFSAPILWLSANRYVTGCTNSTNKGKYLGIFSSFVAAAQVMGNILSAFVIKYFGQLTFYLIASGFVIVAIILFLFAPSVPKYNEEITVYTLTEKVKKVLHLAVSQKMKPFLPYCFFVGLMLAVTSGFEYKIIIKAIPEDSRTEQNYQTALVFIVQGIVGVAISYTAGKLADTINMKVVLSSFNGLTFIAIIISFISNSEASLRLCYIMGVFWSMGYNGASALTNVVMAKDFEGTIESYAVVQIMSTLATISGLGLSIILDDNISAFLVIILGLLIPAQISIFFYKSKTANS